MKLQVIMTSNQKQFTTKEDFDNFGGKCAGVCYMPHTFNELMSEPKEKTDRRIAQTKQNKHHSVYDHGYITVQMEDVPKALAMVLNNEGMYNTSEKSGRYTKMELPEDEKTTYDKWLNIFSELITAKYKNKFPNYFTDSKIRTLSQENARMLTSVFTPVSLIYTTSYGQWNRIYLYLKQVINATNTNPFYTALKPYLVEFCSSLEQSFPFLDQDLQDTSKNRTLAIYKTNPAPVEEYFGDVYCTTYLASFTHLAQTQRHRTIRYNFTLPEKTEFYIPPILKENQELVSDWLKDCNAVKNKFPQATLLEVNEFGTLDAFILKMKERKCSHAQIEVNQQTDKTLNKYLTALKNKNHPRAEELKNYTNGSRCTFKDYTCPSPCGFTDGINGTRLI